MSRCLGHIGRQCSNPQSCHPGRPTRSFVFRSKLLCDFPVRTAVCDSRAVGALVMLVCVQLFVAKLYRPPVFNLSKLASSPPQTIISLPVHTALWLSRAMGPLVVLVAVHVSVLGLYLPPVSNRPTSLLP